MNNKGWAVLLGLGIGAGVGLGYSLAYRFPFKFDKDGWDILTSIGTVGAVMVALWFGTAAERHRRRDELAKARVTAGRWSLELTTFQHFIGFYRKAASRAASSNTPLLQFLKNPQAFNFVDSALMKISVDHLANMAALPEDAAVKVARAVGMMESLAATRDALLRSERAPMYQAEAQARILRNWQSIAKAAEDLIAAASVVTTSALHAPPEMAIDT